jgi:archaellum biogenesis protein FlaJ (TadC family)
VDSVFEKTKDSFKEKNYGFPQIILSMLLLAAAVLSAIILAVLLYFYNQEQIAYIDIVSLAASSIAVFFASVSLIKQIRDSDKVTFDDKVNARYKRALADNPEIRMAEEKAIIKALIMLRTKNEDLPLTDVYKPDLPIFEKERLLERAYS